MISPAHSRYFMDTYSIRSVLRSGSRSISRTPSTKIRFKNVNGASFNMVTSKDLHGPQPRSAKASRYALLHVEETANGFLLDREGRSYVDIRKASARAKDP